MCREGIVEVTDRSRGYFPSSFLLPRIKPTSSPVDEEARRRRCLLAMEEVRNWLSTVPVPVGLYFFSSSRPHWDYPLHNCVLVNILICFFSIFYISLLGGLPCVFSPELYPGYRINKYWLCCLHQRVRRIDKEPRYTDEKRKSNKEELREEEESQGPSPRGGVLFIRTLLPTSSSGSTLARLSPPPPPWPSYQPRTASNLMLKVVSLLRGRGAEHLLLKFFIWGLAGDIWTIRAFFGQNISADFILNARWIGHKKRDLDINKINKCIFIAAKTLENNMTIWILYILII